MEPTYSMVKKTLIPAMDEALELLQIPYHFSKSDAIYTLQFQQGETVVYCLSAENYRRMAGQNLAFFGVDEVDTMRREVAKSMWNMAMSRLRSGNVYQGFTTSTPEGFNFLYDFFVEENNADRRLIKGKTRDNPYLPKEFIQSLLDNYPPNLIKSYLEGEFTNLTSGQIYYAFDRALNNTDKTLADFPNHILHIGQDFNTGKCASVVHVIHDNRPLALDEIMGLRNTEAIKEAVLRRYPKRRVIIYPDASGTQTKTSASMSDIAILKTAFELNYPNKNPNVKDRINSVNGMLCNSSGDRRYLINTKTCPMLTKTFEQQVYNKAGEPDKEHDLDHPADAAGYFINRMFPIIGQATARIY
jgi:hypothetical protein